MTHARAEADLVQQLLGTPQPLGGGDVVRKHRDGNVLRGGERRDEVEVLEHKADLLGADLRQLLVVEPLRSRPSKRMDPPVGLSRAPSSCRSVVLPDPLGPLQRDHLAAINHEVYSANGLDRHPSFREGPLEVRQLVEGDAPGAAGARPAPSWSLRSPSSCRVLSGLRLRCFGHQPRSRSADAGASRAARQPPITPAMRPPTSAPANTIRIVVKWIGAVRCTIEVTVPVVD